MYNNPIARMLTPQVKSELRQFSNLGKKLEFGDAGMVIADEVKESMLPC